MEITKLIAITVIMFISYKFLKHHMCGCSKHGIEKLENTSECSQQSINDSYKEYIFGGPANFVR